MGLGAERARRVRALRGTAAAVVAVLLASTAHTLSGGDAPPLWLMIAVTILAAPLCVGLVGRRRRVRGQAAAVAVAQLALHTAFAAVGSAAPAAPASLHGAHRHTLAFLDGAAAVDPGSAVMTLGHAAAALATMVVLASGERVLAAIARGIRHLLQRAPMAAPPARAGVARPVIRPAHRAAAPAFFHCVTRRGPPTRRASALARAA